jgi:hypothetical protein
MKKTDILTFVGGLVFFSVVVGVIISKNDRIRSEIEEQVEGFLGVGQTILQQLRFVVAKVERITSELKIANNNSTIVEQKTAPPPDDYDALWQAVEANAVRRDRPPGIPLD